MANKMMMLIMMMMKPVPAAFKKQTCRPIFCLDILQFKTHKYKYRVPNCCKNGTSLDRTALLSLTTPAASAADGGMIVMAVINDRPE